MDEQGTNEIDELALAPVTVVSRKRPKALWGVLAAVAVAAGALAATSGGGEDSTPPLLPIALGSPATGRQAEGAADSMLAWVTYVPGDALPALGGEAPAYKLSGTVDEAQVQALAAALGLEGEPVQQDGMWSVTGADGAVLQVSEGAGATWWYSAVSPDVPLGRPNTGVAEEECAAVSSEDGTVTECAFPHWVDPDCVTPEGGIDACVPATTLAPMPPEDCPPSASCAVLEVAPVDCAEVEAGDCPGRTAPPADLPSEDEAREIALALLAATGLETADAVVTVDGPFDAWYVSVEPAIDGTPSGLLANVAVGSGGTVASAGGYLGTPERLGSYPLLDTRAAIDRLNEQLGDGGWFAYSPGVARDIVIASDEDPSAACLGPADATTTIPCPDDTGDTTTTFVPTTVPPCKVQADGSEICEGSGSGEAPTPVLPECPDLVPPVDQPLPEESIADCALVDPIPDPMPEPEPTEVVLTDATPILVLVPANDGSTDAYLVPGYRFTGDDGARVDAPAIADASLAGPTPTEPPVEPPITGTSTVPDPGGTDGTPPSGCEPLVEEDSAGTTHTIQPCVGTDPTELTIGVGYYVDVDLGCGAGTFALGGRIWNADDASLLEAAGEDETFEGGTFTLTDAQHGTFVGDAAGTKRAGFHVLGPAEDIFCVPAERP
jgi:hypothetical protein